MLSTLRKQSRSIIIYVLFGIIIVVFVFTFNVAAPDAGCAGGGRGSSNPVLITIGDIHLDLADLHMGMALSADPPPIGATRDARALQLEWLYRTTRFVRLGGGQTRYLRYGQDPLRVSPIKARKVADDLIETYLVSEEARRLGLRVADHEVRDRLVAEFKDSEGNFKKGNYENWVRYGLKTSVAKFEDFVRREMLRERMIDLVTAHVTLPEREARLVARLREAKREYEYLEISPEALAEAIPVSDLEAQAFLATRAEEAKTYFDEHKEEFREEGKFDFHIAKFSAASRKFLALVTDEEQKSSLRQSWEDAKARVEEAASRLKGLSGQALVEAFEAMAKEMSDHAVTKERGGRVEAPWPESAVAFLEPALVSVLKSVEPGTLAEPIVGDDGYYLVLLRERTEPREPTFEEAKVAVARKLLRSERAKAMFDKEVSRLLEEARGSPGESLRTLAERANSAFAPHTPIKFGEVTVAAMAEGLGELDAQDPDVVPGIGPAPEMAKAMRSLSTEQPVADKTFEVGGSSSRFIVRLKAVQPPPDVPSDEALKRAKEDLLTLKRVAWYREWYESLKRKAAQDGRLVEHEALTRLLEEEVRSLEEASKQRAAK